MVVIDTEFLFALRKDDRHHKQARAILESSTPLTITIPSLFEVILVLMSRGKSKNEIISFLETIWELIEKFKINIAEFKFKDLIEGLKINRDYGKGGLFDSLIAGVAREYEGKILANDSFFEDVVNLKRISYNEFLDES